MIRERAQAIADRNNELYVKQLVLGKHADKVIEGINRKDGHCPCELIVTPDNLCPCITFRNKKECRCGLFIGGTNGDI